MSAEHWPTRHVLSRTYVGAVTVVGLALLAAVIAARLPHIIDEADSGLVLLVAAVAMGELFPIRAGADEGEVAPSTTFTFAILMAYGIPAAVGAQAVGSLVADAVYRKPFVRSAFNIAQYTLAIAAAGKVFELLADPPRPGEYTLSQLLALICAGAVFFVINTGMVAIVLTLTHQTPLREQLSGSLAGEAVTETILIGLAPLAVVAVQTNVALLPLLALPMVAVQRAGRQARLNERLALHDALTGLPNRTLLADRLGHALTLRARGQGQLAVLLLDLDRFKVINDSLGHSAGDELLRHVAARLSDVVREADTVARLGGDEFVVVLESIAGPEEVEEVATRILDTLAEPVTIGGSDIVVDASVGIVVAEGTEEPETLLRHADLAMYRAKARGRGRHEEFVDALAVGAAERLATETSLRQALREGQLFLVYQLIVDLRGGGPVGVEALIRWQHPDRGVIGPGEFLPVARESGLLVPLTRWVMNEALCQVARWKAELPEGVDVQVHVNVPAAQLADPRFADRVLELLERTNSESGQLCLEVTEDALVEVAGPGLEMLRRLREHGVSIALDDFGTGYSSLSQLRQLPVDTLKIDLSFIAAITTEPADANIVRTIIDLAHGFGLSATAEGIETDEQVRVLRELGCEKGQGYRFARPLAPDAVSATLREHVRS